jgi:hypothetical protein
MVLHSLVITMSILTLGVLILVLWIALKVLGKMAGCLFKVLPWVALGLIAWGLVKIIA